MNEWEQFAVWWKESNDEDSWTLYTSGSTGQPKPIQFKKKQFITAAKRTGQYLGCKKNHHAALILSPHRIGGLMAFIRCLHFEMTYDVIQPRLKNLKEYWESNPPEHHISITPPFLQYWFSFHSTLPSKLLSILIGGAPVNALLEQALIFHPFLIAESYGMTETCSMVAAREISPHFQSQFKFLPSINGKPSGELGTLTISDPISEDVIDTHDRVVFGEDGFSYLGRTQRVINKGGLKIQADQLENELRNLFQHEELFVDELSDPFWGQVPVIIWFGDLQRFKSNLLEQIRLTFGKDWVPFLLHHYDLKDFPLAENEKGSYKTWESIKHLMRPLQIISWA